MKKFKMKYKTEKGVRVYYTEDLLYKIVPYFNGYKWYKLEYGEYKCIGESISLYEARNYLKEVIYKI